MKRKLLQVEWIEQKKEKKKRLSFGLQKKWDFSRPAPQTPFKELNFSLPKEKWSTHARYATGPIKETILSPLASHVADEIG
jgi:hypothetical protein